MECTSCGSENPPNARFCTICGEIVGLKASATPEDVRFERMPHRHLRQVDYMRDTGISDIEKLARRLLGGIAWLMVAFGTFMIAFGWLGAIGESSYYDDPMSDFRLMGYGMVVYGVAAILFSVRTFVKTPR